jgi:hypothetical protein
MPILVAPKFPQAQVSLTMPQGTWALIVRTEQALKAAGAPYAELVEYYTDAMECPDLPALLEITRQWVTMEE